MTRHFLRDRNGEETEITERVSRGNSTFDYYHAWVSPDNISWSLIGVRKVEMWINQKLEFIVWQEV